MSAPHAETGRSLTAVETLVERLTLLIEPYAHVLHVGATPSELLLKRLYAQECHVTVLESVQGLPPTGTFDVVVSNASMSGGNLTTIVKSLPALLEDDGYAVLVISGCSNRACDVLDRVLQEAGFVAGYTEFVDAPTSHEESSTLMALIFPLPAIEITVFREMVHALARRCEKAQQQARFLSRTTSELKAGIAASRRRLDVCEETVQTERDRSVSQQKVIDALNARLQQYQAAIARQAASEAAEVKGQQDDTPSHEAAAINALRAELELFKRLGGDEASVRVELDSLREALQIAQSQTLVMRQSFSWRITAPMRALARRLGKVTTDASLGWRA